MKNKGEESSDSSSTAAFVRRKLNREPKSAFGVFPSLFQLRHRDAGHSLESRLIASEDHHCSNEKAKIEAEPVLLAFFLELFQKLQGVPPPRRDLRERQIRASQLAPSEFTRTKISATSS